MVYCLYFIAFVYIYIYIKRRGNEHSLSNQTIFNKDYTLPIRGICALLVVTGHLENYLMGSMTGKVLGNIYILHIFHWSSPAVSVFFFLSGYGLYKKLEKKPIQNFSWISASLIKVGLSLLIFCTVYIVTYYILDKDGCIALLEKAIFKGTIEILPHSWYMYVLLLLYFIFWLCFRVFKNYKAIIVLCICVLLYSLLIYLDGKQHLDMGLWTKAIWSFPLGVIVCSRESQIKLYVKEHFKIVYVSIPCFIILVASIVSLTNIHTIKVLIYHYMFVNVLGFLVYIMCIYLDLENNKIRSFAAYLGSISMEIYLTQGIFQQGLLSFIDNKYLYVILNYLLIILFAAGMHKLLMRIGLFKSK